ncbi:MAG TPA: SRPBCC domain-containing protein [Candidatus Acidoferrales bacterium]|nr:SRPBCC domain-containing protein [Candidatus Acidoferrales bacterium]HVC38771.1 SRPBCC domain-containing protein [Candidatus Dormibacteraeota bacterium]
MKSIRAARHINAPPAADYRALLDVDAIAKWRVPAGMTSRVQESDAREGGAFRITLTYDPPTQTGKTTENSDTCHGRFTWLLSNQEVVEVIEFETSDPSLLGAMTTTTTLVAADDGTAVLVVHQGIPPGVSARDDELGTRMSLAKPAALVEKR